MILFWGRWRGTERLLWHPKGGYVRPEEALPPRLATSLLELGQSGELSVQVEAVDGRAHTWTALPVTATTGAGVLLAAGRYSERVMRELGRLEFKDLWARARSRGTSDACRNYRPG